MILDLLNMLSNSGDIFFQIDFIGSRTLADFVTGFCPLNPSTEFGWKGSIGFLEHRKGFSAVKFQKSKKDAIYMYMYMYYIHKCTFQE